MTTDRAQRVDEKNGATYLSIMLTPRVMVIKMSKMAYFLYLLMRGKNQSQFRQNNYVHLEVPFSFSESSHLALSENVMEYWVLSYHQQKVKTFENTGFQCFFC